MEEESIKLERKLKETYGEIITVRYIDTEKVGLQAYPQAARVVQMGYGFPIVAVNGQPRFAGAIDLEQIQDVIKETLEEK